MNPKPTILLLTTLLLATTCFSQGDIIIIKKNGVRVKTFFTGSLANFQTTSGEWFNSKITTIRDDSLFFREVVVRQVMTQFGVTRLDTMTTYVRGIHYSEIAGIPKPKKGMHVKPETLLMVCGAGYVVLNLINSGYLREPVFSKSNTANLLAATGAFAAGLVISKLRVSYYAIGKKYTLHYVPLGKQ